MAGRGKVSLLTDFVDARLADDGSNKSQPQQVTESQARQVTKSRSQHGGNTEVFRRATYYLRPEQIKALKLRAVEAERNLSAVVREAVDTYLANREG